MEKFNATVLYPAGKVFSTKVPKGGKDAKRQSLKVKLHDTGKELSIWFESGHPDYCGLHRGDVVQVVCDRGINKILFDNSPTPKATPAMLSSPAPQPDTPKGASDVMPPEEKAVLFSQLCLRAKILRTCHVQVQTMFTSDDGDIVVTESTIQKYAAILFADLRSFWQ